MQARMWMLGKAAEKSRARCEARGLFPGDSCVVAAPGLEPGCPKARHFECRVSTYSTTLPFGFALSEVLAACRTWIVESENRPQRAQFLPDLQPNSQLLGKNTVKNAPLRSICSQRLPSPTGC